MAPVSETIDLFLFTTDPILAKQAWNAAIGTFVIDWEHRDKYRRQHNADTEINQDRPEDIRILAQAVPKAQRVCRINAFHDQTRQEIDLAIAHGATHLLLPMVRHLNEVHHFLDWIAGRVQAGILLETCEACELASSLARLPLDLVFMGLNDLAISRRTSNLFAPLADGLAERLRQEFAAIPFGLGGLTRVDQGTPIPCALLMTEYARLNCTFSFLRRSFKRDVSGNNMQEAVAGIQNLWRQLRNRSQKEIFEDRNRFLAIMATVERHFNIRRSFDSAVHETP